MRILSFAVVGLVLTCGALACGDTIGSPIVEGEDSSVGGDGDTGVSSEAGPGADAAPGDIVATLTLTTLVQNCMPVVAPDPTRVEATLRLTNQGSTPVGPVTVSGGRILVAASQVLRASFTATGTSGAAIAPGQTVEIAVVKDASSLEPKTGCSVLACNQEEYAVEVDYGGPAVAAGAKAQAAARAMSCVH